MASGNVRKRTQRIVVNVASYGIWLPWYGDIQAGQTLEVSENIMETLPAELTVYEPSGGEDGDISTSSGV